MIINNEFIKQHDRLVRVIVNQFKVANVDPEDLMQEGRIGLIEAAKRFDPNRGNSSEYLYPAGAFIVDGFLRRYAPNNFYC